MKPFIYILGVPNFANYEATAALIRVPREGGIIEYVTTAEERFSRVKHAYTFPLRGVHHCLQTFGLESLAEVDFIYTDYARIPRWLNSGPGYRKLEHDYLKLRLNYPRERIRVVDHHDAHAASAFYPSPFSEAAVLIVDGLGSRGNTQTLYHFTQSDAKELERGDYWGVGRLYELVTRNVLPYGPEKGYGKVMGLAPYGRGHPGPVLEFGSRDAGLTTDYSAFSTRAPLPRIVAGGVRKCEDREAVLEPYFARAAYDVQQECERQMVRMARYAHERTGARYLCVAGGVGLNGLSNARVLQETPFEDVWITPGCSDTGLPLGLALWGYFQDIRQAESPRVSVSMPTAYTGRPYPRNETIALLERYGIAHETAEPERVAHLIAAGKVVGWFEGGSEFGPRALGHRSILADPRDPGMKDTLNRRVKFREPYRPYAPSLLEEHAAEWLHLDGPSPFMLMVVEVREDKRALVPAITHIDNTTRPQTVTEATNPNYYRMIKEFHRLTGVPMVLNTSLNVNREPIVETPIDALICVFSTAIDFLYLEGELIDCAPYARPELVQQLTAHRTRTLDEEWKTVIGRYLTQYDQAERDAYLAEENRLAEWHRDYRAKYELEKKVLEWNAHRTRIAIVGTRGHTRSLYEYIDGFASLDVAGFIPLDERPGERGDFSRVYREATTPFDLAGVGAILVSTHEYQSIADDLRRIVPAGVEVFTMYDDAGDSLMYVLPGRWPVLNELSGLTRPSVSVTRSAVEQEPGTEADPAPPGLAERYALIIRYEVVDPETLDRQLKALTQNFVCTTLGRLMDPRAQLPEVVAVLTFDYGLRDVVENVLPALQRWKVPATLFCPAPPLMQRKLLDVHRLQLGRVDDERAAVASLYLSPDDVRRCQDAGLEVAMQGHQYMVHSIRTQDEQRRDLQRAIDYFKATFNSGDLHWAHPYGADGMCDITPRLTLQDVGFRSGVTRMKAIVKPSDVAARWELPRFDVSDVFDASDHLRPDKLNALFVAD